MLHSNRNRMALTLFALAAFTACSANAQQQGTGEKIGERIDEAAAALRRGVDRAGETVKEQFARAKSSVNALGIEGRVYGRLHWDKALEGATIDIEASSDGTVTLTGSVADGASKMKAVRLATDTVGVSRVVDQLATRSSTP